MSRKILVCLIFSLCFIKSYSYKLETLEEKALSKKDANEQHLLSSSYSNAKCDCEHGDCELDSSGVYKCVCWPEFGRFSDTRCKECLCGPAANCTIEAGWFKDRITCICPKNVTKGDDKRCEDPCESNPCQNEGHCSVDYNGVKCDCQHPYTGKFCEDKKPVCLDNTCAHGGTCIEEENEPKCICRPNFSGPTCEDTLCLKKPCQNGGICQIVHHEFACFCKYPFHGLHCEKGGTTSTPSLTSTNTDSESTNDSTTTSDLNDTTKHSESTDELKTTFSSPPENTEEINTDDPSTTSDTNETIEPSEVTDDFTSDPCNPNPCKYDFKCKVIENTFQCACKLPYTGNTCEITPCTRKPCKNGATCTVHKWSTKCKCQPGFYGDKCDKKIEISTEEQKNA